MRCQHVFCSNCAVKMQKQRRKFCPLCREDVVLQADEGKSTLLFFLSISLEFLRTMTPSLLTNPNLLKEETNKNTSN